MTKKDSYFIILLGRLYDEKQFKHKKSKIRILTIEELYMINGGIENPDLIHPGQKIVFENAKPETPSQKSDKKNGRRNKLKAKIRKQAITMTDKKIQYMRMKKV
ncbi:hypothetical protein JO40_06435 [Treponema putidum]|nr:hypothetical protein JO40_06435 [Treponema putidum]